MKNALTSILIIALLIWAILATVVWWHTNNTLALWFRIEQKMESCLIDCNAKLSSLKELEEVSLWYVTYYTPNLDAKGKCDYLNFNPIISESAAGRSVIPSYKEVLAAKDFLGIDPWCDISYMDKLDNARIEPFTATRCGELNGQGIGELVTFVPKFKYFYWWSSDGKMGQWVEGGALNEAWIDFYAKHLCGE